MAQWLLMNIDKRTVRIKRITNFKEEDKMALKINTNIASLNAHTSMVQNDSELSESLLRLSTGLRINKAADDSSGMAIADILRQQTLGIGQAMRNASDGISMVQIADGAIQESINIVNTIKTKAIQAASDGQTTATRRAIQNDIDKLMEELNNIAMTTSYGGQKLLSGVFTNKALQIGAYANETANFSVGSTAGNKIGHISQAELHISDKNGGKVQLTITSSLTGEKMTLNSVDLLFNNNKENGMGGLANELNRYTSMTGISAKDVVTVTTKQRIAKGVTGKDFAINGIKIGAIPIEVNDRTGALVNAINTISSETGVEAFTTINGHLTLRSLDGRAIDVKGSINDVLGMSSDQMSTLGHLELTQSGVNQFQIVDFGSSATGAAIKLKSNMTTSYDSILANGTKIAAGSQLARGTFLGGDALVELSIKSSAEDYELQGSSTLYPSTKLKRDSTIGGTIIVRGNTKSNSEDLTAIEKDMLLTTGSVLTKGTIIGAGTVLTTDIKTGVSNLVIPAGSMITTATTLNEQAILKEDMILKYNNTDSDNTKIAAGSKLATGSKLGADFEIGFIWDDSSLDAMSSSSIATKLTADLYSTEDLVISSNSSVITLAAGSLLLENSIIGLISAGSTATEWDGPTLRTNAGVIKRGDTIKENTLYTLSADQVLSEDLKIIHTAATSTIKKGSVLAKTTSIADADWAKIDGDSAGSTATLHTAIMVDETIMKSGSQIAAGSKLATNSKLGDITFVMGGILNAKATDLITKIDSTLESGSIILKDSELSKGSTIGGTSTINSNSKLDDDMRLAAGTILSTGTNLRAGSFINEEIVLNTQSDGSGTEITVSAGELTRNLWVTTTGGSITLTKSAIISEDSIIAQNTIINADTTSEGNVGLTDIETYRLSDVSVLNQERAQRSITLASSALANLDWTRSQLGSIQNQLTATISNLAVTKSNVAASESAIREIDFAEESMIFSKLQLLAQTSSYALAQANTSSQHIMNLLQ